MNIISLSPSTTEIFFALGAGHLIVGNTYFCDYPLAAKKIPKVGSWTDIHFERIAELYPDIIFTSTVVQERLKKQLESRGYNVVHFDPRSLRDIYVSIRKMGRLVDHVKQSQKIIDKMKEQEESLRKTKRVYRPKIYVEEWFDPPMVSGNWMPDIVEIAGGTYGLIKKHDISRVVTLQEVTQYDPDIILSSYCGFGKNSRISSVTERSQWSKLRAITEKQVFALDDTYLNRPGPRVLSAAFQMQKIIRKIYS